AGGPGRAPDGADQRPHRSLQAAHQGPPFSAWPLDADRQAPGVARVPEEQGRRALSRPHRQARAPPVTATIHGSSDTANRGSALPPARRDVRRIPGGYCRREGAPSKKETLTSRLIDRPIRPLFPGGFRNEVQVICLAISADQQNDPDILAMNGASVALCLSGVPFDGPVGALRVGLVDGTLVANPTNAPPAVSS